MVRRLLRPKAAKPASNVLLSVLLFSSCVTASAHAHDWYDPTCCSGYDCHPVAGVAFVSADLTETPVMVVTTPRGTAAVNSSARFSTAQDSRMHACIYAGKLLCVYLPPSQ